jgi:uncharacterized protein
LTIKITPENTAHRPYPVSTTPWIQEQVWDDLVFAHWTVPVDVMRRAVPSQLELDLWDNKAWIGVVPFNIPKLRFRWLPTLPFVGHFLELNVRTYVTYKGKPGVYFFSLDAANILAVIGARQVYHLPYFEAQMSMERQGEWYNYHSNRKRGKAEFVGRYRATGPMTHSARGSHEYWLTERYCLYSLNRSGNVCRAEIHHPQWDLQPAELEIQTNTMAQAAGFTLEGSPVTLHFSKHQDVLAWPLERA